MGNIKAADGTPITDEMIDDWCEVLDRDEWPKGWQNVGEVIQGGPPTSAETEVLSVKIPAGMKRAVEQEAEKTGLSLSAYVRDVLASSLLA